MPTIQNFDPAAKSFDYTCPRCHETERNIPLTRLHTEQHPHHEHVTSVRHECVSCGMVWCMATDLDEAEETDEHPGNPPERRAEVRNVRAICLAVGMQREAPPELRALREHHRHQLVRQPFSPQEEAIHDSESNTRPASRGGTRRHEGATPDLSRPARSDTPGSAARAIFGLS